MSNKDFFEKPTEQSLIKAQIVAKYFGAYQAIMVPMVLRKAGKIGYIDLYSGPGRYRDGTPSTPLLILQQAIANPDLTRTLVSIFNDSDPESCNMLRKEIDALEGIERLAHKPRVTCMTVGSELVQLLNTAKLIPSLIFLDPFGYKGLSSSLLRSVLNHWGCDVIFFFNYNRINIDFTNPVVVSDIDALFGETEAAAMRQEIAKLNPIKREDAIFNGLACSLKKIGGLHVKEFCFKMSDSNRTSHYLIFVSKNRTAYRIVKDVMAGLSSHFEQGVASYTFDPHAPDPGQGNLFDLLDDSPVLGPLDKLKRELLERYAGRSLTVVDLYQEHHLGRNFRENNYKDALKQLEIEKHICIDPPSVGRRAGTLANSCILHFPERTTNNS
jgi:three-Cys-motif partner protein